MSERQQLDLTPFICEAFASNKTIHKTLEKIYEKDRVEYYQMAKANKWYNHEILTSQSIQKEIMAKRALAILLEGDYDKLLQIIRKGWKTLYDYTKKQKVVRISDAYALMMPKSSETLNRLTNDEINAVGIITIILARLLDKKINETDEGYIALITNVQDRLEAAKGIGAFSLKTFPPDVLKKVRKLKDNIYRDASINKSFISHQNSKLKALSHWSTSTAFLFDIENLSSSIVEDEPLSEKEIEEILATYYYIFQNDDTIEGAKYLASGYIIRALLKAYKRVKNEHFKTSRETLYLDLDTAEHQAQKAQEEVRRLQGIISQRDNEILDLRKQITSEYGRAVQEYQSKIKTAQTETQEFQRKLFRVQEEIEELRKIVFTPTEESGDLLSDIDLSLIRGVIVGGHERWHDRLKTILPDDWKFIHPDSSYDLSILANTDMLFFFTGYLTHAIYYDFIGEARRRNIKVGYLKRTNEEECLRDIQRGINRS